MEEYSTSMTSTAAATNPGATMASATSTSEDERYIFSTKIMVVALAVLFAVVFFVICLHIYSKWAWSTRAPASVSFWPSRWRRGRDSQILQDSEMLDMNIVVGLGKAAVDALPTFQYKTDIEVGALECAICLGQFQEDELGRTLPRCNHRFHVECIDMWLYSHSTCPLCRDVLGPEEEEEEEEENEDDDDDDVSESLNLVDSSSVQVFRAERGARPGDCCAEWNQATNTFTRYKKRARNWKASKKRQIKERMGSQQMFCSGETSCNSRAPSSGSSTTLRIKRRLKHSATETEEVQDCEIKAYLTRCSKLPATETEEVRGCEIKSILWRLTATSHVPQVLSNSNSNRSLERRTRGRTIPS